ncbi:ATP-binding cassette domain-containing protein [Facklamia lactis]|uniref:ATP-binding cassette domain-containing protein n=1 Tax=Facklamia lactis TaxID=2749967 RepID=UPI0018CC9C89|nr:ABC transporter ATP-binding protein [Facklamia lactis]MBG9980491.1 ABC transporter ATP-binding protein [Facklamia lactis]
MVEIFNQRRKELIIFTLLTISLSILTVSSALILKLFSDVAQNQSNITYSQLVIITSIFILVQYGIHYFQQLQTEKLSKLLSNDMKKRIIQYISELTIDEFHEKGVGYYISLLTSQVKFIEDNFFYSIFWGGYLFCQFLAALIGSMLIQPKLVIFSLLLCIPFVLIPYLLKSKIVDQSEKITRTIHESQENIQDFLNGKVIWNSYGKNDKFIDLATNNINTLYEHEADKITLDNQIGIINKIFSEILFYGTWLAGIYFILKGQLTFGSLLAFTNLIANLAFPLNSAIGILTNYIGGNKVANDLMDMINTRQNRTIIDFEKEYKASNCLEFDDVTLNKQGRQILNHIDVQFDLFHKYLIIGESGSGKSSLIKILFENPQLTTGKIYYKGQALTYQTNQDFIEEVAYIPQDGYIFYDSLFNNITLFEKNPDSEKVLECLKMSGLSKWSQDEIINKNSISGGEKQRLLLARALYKDPKFLIIDELSSSLDPQLIPQIEETLLNLPIGFICISHKYTSNFAQKVDKIFVVENGLVIETQATDIHV